MKHVPLVNIDTVELEIHGQEFRLANATTVNVVSPDGELQSCMQNRIYVAGAQNVHRVALRTMDNGSTLLLEGSLAAFLYGQNLFTSNDMYSLCLESLKRVTKQLGIQLPRDVKDRCKRGEIELTRVDLAVNFRLKSEDEVRSIVTQVKRQLVEQDARVVCHYSAQWSHRYSA